MKISLLHNILELYWRVSFFCMTEKITDAKMVGKWMLLRNSKVVCYSLTNHVTHTACKPYSWLVSVWEAACGNWPAGWQWTGPCGSQNARNKYRLRSSAAVHALLLCLQVVSCSRTSASRVSLSPFLSSAFCRCVHSDEKWNLRA